jgi:hypothetical protein
VLLRLVEDHPADPALLARDHLPRAEFHVPVSSRELLASLSPLKKWGEGE